MVAVVILILVLLLSSLCTRISCHAPKEEEYDTCPLWTKHSRNNRCECISFRDIAWCGLNNSLHITSDFCLTWDNATGKILLSECPYIQSDCNNSRFYTVTSDVNLNDFCSRFKRQGANCKDCMDGYGPAPFFNGPNIPCADCSHHRHIWLLNLVLQLFMITLLYFTFVASEFRGTSSPTNVLAYFYQIASNEIIALGNFQHLSCYVNCGVIDTCFALITPWNLDFFRFFIPPLCVSPSLSNADVVLFEYLIAFYPIVLTLLSYLIIVLHDNGSRFILFVLRPIKRIFSKIKKDWNPKQSLLNTFATFMLLSYSKILFTSCIFLYPSEVYDYHDYKPAKNSPVLLYDASLTYFGKRHLPYAIFSLSVLLLFVVLPPLVLLLYPTKCFKRGLELCKFRRWHSLSIIMDIFQGWYKDGTGNMRDYRGLSALYMLLRIGFAIELMLIHLKSQAAYHYASLTWVIPALVHICLGCFHLVLKPYKKDFMNVIDGLVLILFGVLCFTFFSKNVWISTLVFSLPMLTAFLYIVIKCLKKAHLFDIVINYKRAFLALFGVQSFSGSDEHNCNELISSAANSVYRTGGKSSYGTVE